MGCCGGGRTNKNKNTKPKAAKTSASLPGAKGGMVLLEYNGKNFGDETWRGPVTNAIYVLGGVTRRQYVDAGDAGSRNDSKSMLGWRENGRWIFNPINQLRPKPKPIIELPKVEIIEPQNVELDMDKLTVKALEDNLAKGEYSTADIIQALELEQMGRNRQSAIKALEAALG